MSSSWLSAMTEALWHARWLLTRTRVYSVRTEDGWIYKWQPVDLRDLLSDTD